MNVRIILFRNSVSKLISRFIVILVMFARGYVYLAEVLRASGNMSILKRRLSGFLRNPRRLTNMHLKLNKTVEKSKYPFIISVDQENFITEGNPDVRQELQELLMLLSMKQERGDTLPEIISLMEMIDLLGLSPDEIDRKLDLYVTRRKKRKMQKSEKKLHMETMSRFDPLLERTSAGSKTFAHHNSLFLPITRTSQSLFYNYNLSKGLSFGQQLFFDCSFDNYMNTGEIKETAHYLNSCIHINGRDRRPFALNLCNVEQSSKVMHELKRENIGIEFDLPVNIHACSYLDLFQREDIVYLSPDANAELEYHPDDVYVIGAMSVDKQRLALKKARLEGVRCMKLPLVYLEMTKRNYKSKIWETFEKLLRRKNTRVFK